MSRQLVLLNVLLAAVAAFFGTTLYQELSSPQPLPAPPAAAAAPPQPAPQGSEARDGEARGGPETSGGYGVIATRSLFHPSRSETVSTPVAAAPAPPPPKPLLHGVVLEGETGRAYLEDPASKRVFGYRVGDAVAGGRLEKIGADRVVIVRGDGSMEVLLRDPAKPRPEAEQPAAAGTRPGRIRAIPPGSGQSVEASPTAPRPLPIPPRLLRRQQQRQEQLEQQQLQPQPEAQPAAPESEDAER